MPGRPGRKSRSDETFGLKDAQALRLYEESKAILEERGHFNAATAAVLKSAAQWQQEASEIARAITRYLRGRSDEDAGTTPARLRAMMKTKAMCEGEMRRSLDDLMLLPRPPRGRPRDEASDGEEDEAQSAWTAFDDDGGGGP